MKANDSIWTPARALKPGDRVRFTGKLAKRFGAKEFIVLAPKKRAPQ